MTEYNFLHRPFQFGGRFDEAIIWNRAVHHRAMVSKILVDKSGGRQGKLAVLGAGQCCDIDLNVLREWYEEVHLFDLDGNAVWKGVEQQGHSGADWIKIHGGIDVTGHESSISTLNEDPNRENRIAEIIDQAPKFRLREYSKQFDVVASTCMLSQILKIAIDAVGEDHKRLIELLNSLRLGHLLTLVDLCKPKGTCNLFFDFVSAETLPEIVDLSGDKLRRLLSDAIHEQNFFHGMNPVVINDVLVNDPAIAPHIEGVKTTMPWIWHAEHREYAVVDVQFQRKR